MKKLFFTILILNSFLICQNQIEKIVIIGNTKTSKTIILNTLNHKVGDSINMNLVIDDKKNLLDLELFNNVIVYPHESIYYIIVKEKSNFLFTPLLSKDEVLGWSYGIGVEIKNIKNLPQEIDFGIMTGEITSYFLEYSKINLDKKYNSFTNRFFKSNYSSIENDYILTQSGFSTMFSFNNNIKFVTALFYNEADYINQEDVLNTWEVKNTILYNKINLALKNTLNHNNNLQISYSFVIGDYDYENNNYNHLLNILNKYSLQLEHSDQTPRIVFKNQIILNSSSNIPIYEKIYLSNEDYVRGYAIKPENNDITIQDKIKWNNMLLSSLQLEFPLSDSKFFNTELLFFVDYGLGSNTYYNFNDKNRLRGFGVGVRYKIAKYGGADMCFGLNPYNGEKQFHFIANFKNF